MQAAHNNQDGRGEEPRANVPERTPEQREFAEVAKSFEMEVFGYLRRRVKNRSDALELTQKTFLNAWKAWSSVAKDGNIRAWLMTIAEHVAIDFHRNLSAEKRGEALSLDAMTSRGTYDGEAPGKFEPADYRSKRSAHEDLEAKERHEALEAAIPLLSSDDQRLIRLHLAHKSYAEIAEETGRSEGAIGPALTRIRARLGAILNPNNEHNS